MDINEAIGKYTAGEMTAEAVNGVLREAGAGFSFRPGQNVLTEADLRETTVGHYPEQANGWGLLDTGTGSLDKVRIVNGKLDYPVNQVNPDGSTSMAAYVHICGKIFQVFGNTLGFMRGV